MAQVLALLSALVIAATAQTTCTGCHMHGSMSYCFAPNGEETAVATITSSISAPPTGPVSAVVSTTAEPQTTVVTGCHLDATNVVCINGQGERVSVSLTKTPTNPIPAQYANCHAHETVQYCVDPQGNDVAVVGPGKQAQNHQGDDQEHSQEPDCHFHAGVEHCVAAGHSEASETSNACDAPSIRDYNIGLRVGSIFVVLATSGLAVFGPLLMHKLPVGRINHTIFTVVKQFGTGIIISTAFVHLITHASLMFTNKCVTGI